MTLKIAPLPTTTKTSVTSYKTRNFASDCQTKCALGNWFLLHWILVYIVATFSGRQLIYVGIMLHAMNGFLYGLRNCNITHYEFLETWFIIQSNL
jgi:hypothetical protein